MQWSMAGHRHSSSLMAGNKTCSPAGLDLCCEAVVNCWDSGVTVFDAPQPLVNLRRRRLLPQLGDYPVPNPAGRANVMYTSTQQRALKPLQHVPGVHAWA